MYEYDGGIQRSTDVREPLVIAAGQTQTYVGTAFQLYTPSQTSATIVSIAGTVEVRSETTPSFTRALGAQAQGGDAKQLFAIQSTGTMRITATGEEAVARGYWVDGFNGASFLNEGRLVVSSSYFAEGVQSYALDGTYINRGVVQVTAPLAVGFFLQNLETPAYFHNTGVIEVRADMAGRASGVDMRGHTSSFRNEAGASIIVSHSRPAEPGQLGFTEDVAVHIQLLSHERVLGLVYRNAGLIQGEVALWMERGPDINPDFATYERRFLNEATGVLRGRVDLSGKGVVLDNAGLIDGSVSMGRDNEIYDGSRGGRVTGMISGGAGDDQMWGGPQFDYLQGNTGNDNLEGGGGDDWVIGGKDNDSLAGNAGADLVYGNIGADTCDGGDGADIVRGGQDNDILRGGAGDDYVSGDRGDDTVSGGSGADLFHTFGEAGLDRVIDFNASEGDRVQLDPGTQYAVAQVGSDTVITMTGGGQMILVGVQMSQLAAGWIFGA